MPYDNPTLKEFEGYFKAKEPGRRERRCTHRPRRRGITKAHGTRRNPVIADLFQRLDLMERRGSGFGKVLDAYELESKKRDLNRDFSMVVGGGKATAKTATVPVVVNGNKTDAEQLGKVAMKIYRMILANKRITAA